MIGMISENGKVWITFKLRRNLVDPDFCHWQETQRDGYSTADWKHPPRDGERVPHLVIPNPLSNEALSIFPVFARRRNENDLPRCRELGRKYSWAMDICL